MATKQTLSDLTNAVNQNTDFIIEIKDEINSLKSSVTNMVSKMNLILSLLGYNHQQIQNEIHSEEPTMEEVVIPEEIKTEELFVAEELIVILSILLTWSCFPNFSLLKLENMTIV